MTTDPPEEASSHPRWFWWVLAGLVVLAVAAALLVLRAAEPQGGAHRPSRAQTPDQIHPTSRPEEQAGWRFRVYPAGTIGPPAQHERARVKAQRKPLVEAVRRLFDALYFSPTGARPAVRETFSPPAARRWLAAPSGPPNGVKGLRTVTRSASIGVDARTATQAAADVRIVARGRIGRERARFAQEATLWLERAGRRWKVIAFEASRRELPSGSRGAKGGRGGRSHSGRRRHHEKGGAQQ